MEKARFINKIANVVKTGIYAIQLSSFVFAAAVNNAVVKNSNGTRVLSDRAYSNINASKKMVAAGSVITI